MLHTKESLILRIFSVPITAMDDSDGRGQRHFSRLPQGDRKRPAGIPQIAVPIHRRTSPLEIPMDCIPACSQPSSPCTLPRPSPTHGAAKHKAPAQPSPCRGFTKRASSFMLFPFRDGRFRCVRLNAPAERRSVNRFPGARYSCSASARCRRESACR